jgi:hypothetical protein
MGRSIALLNKNKKWSLEHKQKISNSLKNYFLRKKNDLTFQNIENNVIPK